MLQLMKYWPTSVLVDRAINAVVGEVTVKASAIHDTSVTGTLF